MSIDDPPIDSDTETDTEQASMEVSAAHNNNHRSSPRRIRQQHPNQYQNHHVYDRFIPNRAGINLQAAYLLATSETEDGTSLAFAQNQGSYSDNSAFRMYSQNVDRANRTFSTVLKAEIFGNEVPSAIPDGSLPQSSQVRTSNRPYSARQTAHRRPRRGPQSTNPSAQTNNNSQGFDATSAVGVPGTTSSITNNPLTNNLRHIRRHERDQNRTRMARASAQSLRQQAEASSSASSFTSAVSSSSIANQTGVDPASSSATSRRASVPSTSNSRATSSEQVTARSLTSRGSLAAMRSVPDLLQPESDTMGSAISPSPHETPRSNRFSDFNYSQTISSSVMSAPSTPKKKLFQYNGGLSGSPQKAKTFGGRTRFYSRIPGSGGNSPFADPLAPNSELYSTSPMRLDSQRLLLTPEKRQRKINTLPTRVLDAPQLADDFYLNLMDWGSKDLLGVGLSNVVYAWSGETSAVSVVCKLEDASVASVSWAPNGTQVAVGVNNGSVLIFDVGQSNARLMCELKGHDLRVASLSWNNDNVLSSGSQDRLILNRDIRQGSNFVAKFTGHRQEVCGLRWNGTDDSMMASGGNDNRLLLWDGRNASEPVYGFTDFAAAVKAIAWSPHQRGLLAAGGGTADKRIRFWNANTGTHLQDIDTGSQVCNLAWSKTSQELVSTHGFSHNQITIWDYPSMDQVSTLTGHTYRVLYLAMSPDGTNIATGAGDETLRFWNVFEKKQERSKPSLLDVFQQLR